MPTPSSPHQHPRQCDVLVIGAGPAGSACAQWLARAGRDVLLVDQHDFPRDKVCGDGLIPDTHAALQRLGVLDEVRALAQPVAHVRCVGPRGAHVDVPGTLSVLPRKVLDDVLVRAAQRAGARLLTPLKFEAPILESSPGGERVGGARFKTPDGTHEITARWVILATGAVPQALIAAGLCERRTPSGVALRGYVRNPAMVDTIKQLQLVWHSRLRGGYGWIFPAPGGVFNIGAGLTGSHIVQPGGQGKMRKMQDNTNLRGMFDAFCEVHAPAGELMRSGELLGDIKGAPLRCTLRGARWSRPGMLATGEAAGSTYAFSGEGIGKAMETGMLAADAVLEHGAHGAQATNGIHGAHGHVGSASADANVQQAYAASLRALQPRFDLYESASRVNMHPWLADLVVWRGRKSPSILRRLSGVLEETQSPGRLFSWNGMRKLMFE